MPPVMQHLRRRTRKHERGKNPYVPLQAADAASGSVTLQDDSTTSGRGCGSSIGIDLTQSRIERDPLVEDKAVPVIELAAAFLEVSEDAAIELIDFLKPH